MNELIKIQNYDTNKKAVSARELHEFLEVKEKFTDWIKRMFEYGFQEQLDFVRNIGKSTGGRKQEDYAITIGCAKEISMLQRSEKGKQARQYFIECERVAKGEATKPISSLDMLKLSIKAIEEQGQQISAIEERVNVIEARQITSPIEYYSVAGFWTLNKTKIDATKAKEISYKARKACNDMGYQIGKIPDAKYGTVNTYPSEILEIIFLREKNLPGL